MNITGKTKVYGIFGNPVGHSFSPAIQNAGFKEKKLDCVYVAFLVKDLKQAVDGIRTMGIQGLSITIPFKIEIISLLDEIHPLAKKIGAVNTVLNQNGKLIGYNTDGIGAKKALLEKEKSLAGKKITLIGCGGAARAVGFTLAEEKPSKMEILVREADREAGEKLAHEIQSESGIKTGCLLIESSPADYDILINSTPVGMSPQMKQSPVSKEWVLPGKTVFDIIYNPKETLLIQYAREKKCPVVYGYKMLLNQGLEQFRIWTGQEPSAKTMEKILLRCIKK